MRNVHGKEAQRTTEIKKKKKKATTKWHEIC